MNPSQVTQLLKHINQFHFNTIISICIFQILVQQDIKKTNWKMTHSCSCFLFATFYGISTGFINIEGSDTYFTLLGISHAFLTLSILLEWYYFKRGCICESNLNNN